jgi:hypothetical protein
MERAMTYGERIANLRNRMRELLMMDRKLAKRERRELARIEAQLRAINPEWSA